MPTRKTSSRRRYGKAASKKVEKTTGSLKSGSTTTRKKVTSRKQAVAMGMNEARKSVAKAPARNSRKSRSKKAS
jgi:hypothetical protein